MRVFIVAIVLLFSCLVYSEDIDTRRVIVISDHISNNESLIGAASVDNTVVRLETRTTNLDHLLIMIKEELGSGKISSIGFVVHDYGENQFYLTASHSVSLNSTLYNTEQREFWHELGKLIVEGGRIDIFACNLARGDRGKMLISALEDVSGVNVAASTNETGNSSRGGDWVMETDAIDVSEIYFNPTAIKKYSGLLWGKTRKLVAPEASHTQKFGTGVSISGDFAAVTSDAWFDNAHHPVIFLFSRNYGGSNNWGLIKKIEGTVGLSSSFGESVSVSGDYLVVGEPGRSSYALGVGAAHLYYRNQGGENNWGYVKILWAEGLSANSNFGQSLAIDGDNIIIGSKDNGFGSAHIFSRNQGGADNWGPVEKIMPDDSAVDQGYGKKVSISGDYAVVSAEADRNYTGAAYVFYRNHGGVNNWGQVKKLKASDEVWGTDFGSDVSISGETIVVGRYGEDSQGTRSGAAYIYSLNHGGAGNWGQVKKIRASDGAAFDLFGEVVAIDGDNVFVGSQYNDEVADSAGAVYVFSRNLGGNDNWGFQNKLTASDGVASIQFGHNISVSGDNAIIATNLNNSNNSYTPGAYIYNSALNVDVHTVNISSGSGGNTDKDGQNLISKGGSITIVATPDPGYKFVAWSGDASGSENPLTISNLQGDKDVTAEFSPIAGTLRVSFLANTTSGSFSISGPAGFNSGVPLTGQTAVFNQAVIPGIYTVTFTEQQGYGVFLRLGSQISQGNSIQFTVVDEMAYQVSASYHEEFGALQVNFNNAGNGASYSILGEYAVQGFPYSFRIDELTQNYNSRLPAGIYTVTSEALPGQSITITTTTFSSDINRAWGNVFKNETEIVSISYAISFDINKDGSVTPGDALLVLQHYLGSQPLTDPVSLSRADTNGDGSITPGDALLVLKEYLGINN